MFSPGAPFRALLTILCFMVVAGMRGSLTPATAADPPLLKLTFSNGFALPVDIYVLDDDKEVLQATLTTAKNAVLDKSQRQFTMPSKELQTYEGNVWRIKIRTSPEAKVGESVHLYDYVATNQPNQVHQIYSLDFFRRRLQAGAEVVFQGENGTLVADDNPVPRFGPAVQGEPRLQFRSILASGENHNYRWLVKKGNDGKPGTVSFQLSGYDTGTFLVADPTNSTLTCEEKPQGDDAAAKAALAKFQAGSSFTTKLQLSPTPAGYPFLLTRSDSPAGAASKLRLLAIPWGKSASLGSMKTLRLIGLDFDSGGAWRTAEQKGVGEPTEADIKQATTEGTAHTSSIESVDYCQYGYHAIRMDPFDLQNNGLDTKRTRPLFARGSSVQDNAFYASFGYRIPLYLWFQPEKNSHTVEESKMFSSQRDFQDTVSSTYSNVVNTSLSVSATVGTGGMSPVNASATVGSSTNLTFGDGNTLSNSVATNASHGSTTVMRTKWAHEFWLVLNKKHVRLHEDFRKAVNDLMLPDEPGKPPRAEAFFEEFGTHYAAASLFGARITEISAISNDDLLSNTRSSGGTSKETGYKKETADAEKVFAAGSKIERSNKITIGTGGAGTNFESFDKGQVKDYIPIKVYLRPITELIVADLLSDEPTYADVVLYDSLRVDLQRKLERYLRDQSQRAAAASKKEETFSVELTGIEAVDALPAGKSRRAYCVEAMLVKDFDRTTNRADHGYQTHPGYDDKAVVQRQTLLDWQQLEAGPGTARVSLGNAVPMTARVTVDPSQPMRFIVAVKERPAKGDPQFPESVCHIYASTTWTHFGSRAAADYANPPAGAGKTPDVVYFQKPVNWFQIAGRGVFREVDLKDIDEKTEPIFKTNVFSGASDRLNVFLTGKTSEKQAALCAKTGSETIAIETSYSRYKDKTYSQLVDVERAWFYVATSRAGSASEPTGDGMPKLSTFEPK